MTRFRQALLDELLHQIAEPVGQPAEPVARRAGPASLIAPVRSRAPRARRLVLAGVAGGVAVTGGLLVSHLSATPAYAVSQNPDGTVTITANYVGDPQGANRALQKAGVRAVVRTPSSPANCQPGDRGTPVSPSAQQDRDLMANAGHIMLSRNDRVIRLAPDRIPAGTVLVITPLAGGNSGSAVRNLSTPVLQVGLYQAPGPRCVVAEPATSQGSPPSRGAGPSAPAGSPRPSVPAGSPRPSVPAGSPRPGPSGSPQATPSPTG